MSLKTMNKMNASMKKNRGFTLLEALLGFLILSIGMLGIASLQTVSLKAGKTSVYGSVAMMKVDELLESMRINNSAASLAAYAAAGAGVGIDNGCSGVIICSGVQLAQDDVFWWKQNLKDNLPDSAATSVTLTLAAISQIATVQVDVTWWERKNDGTGGVKKTYTTTADICMAIPC